jgi:flagella basal body P-ring formation protein FlgA
MQLGTLSLLWQLISPMLLSVAITTAIAGGEPIRVIVHSRPVSTDKIVVTVGDLATISGGSAFQRTQISQLDIDVISAEKPVLTVPRKQIEMRILLAGVTEDSPRVDGPEMIEVRFQANVEFQKRIESIVQQELSAQFGLEIENVTVTLLDNDAANQVREYLDLGQIDGTAFFSTRLPLGRQSVRMELSDVHGNRYSGSFDFQIVVVRDVLITTEPISKGRVLTEDSFQQTQRPIDDQKIQLVCLDQLEGKVAARDLDSNVLLQSSHITDRSRTARYVVKRNSYVDLIRNDGKINIRLKNARVLTPGAVGDTVEVLNTRSNQKLIGVVQDKSTVLIR